jgi:hypothetical protein
LPAWGSSTWLLRLGEERLAWASTSTA